MFQEDGSSSITSTSLQMYPSTSPYPWLKELKPEERGLYLIHLLVTCANHVSTNSLENANISLHQISDLASPQGDTMQRIASYFSEALADRILRSWPGVYKALRTTKIPNFSEEISVRKMFSEFLPFMKVSYVITNQAIIEAMEGEKMVHVIDLNANEPSQWCALIRDLSARPEGPPHLKITGIHQQKEVLEQMARVLSEEAEKLDLPFQFNPVVTNLENLEIEKLRVKTGEALAISSITQLHFLLGLDNDHDINSFLGALFELSPKVMVVTEQDSDHNGETLMERLSESLYYYATLFDCLESALPRSSLERFRIEKMILGEEIKNVIACEGVERKERHEKLEKWRKRFDLARFSNVPLSYYALLQANRLIQGYKCDGYKLREDNGCAVICWEEITLFSVSAWRFRR